MQHPVFSVAPVPTFTTLPVEILVFKSSSGRDLLSLPASSLLWIQAQQNYVEFCLEDEGEIRSTLLRTTFNSVCRQLPGNFMQTHRSVVINIDNLTVMRKRQRAFIVVMGSSPLELPVSKRYADDIVEYLRHYRPHLRP